MTGTQAEGLGARLRRLREARGLKLTPLAMRVGLTEAAIRQLGSAESGAWPPGGPAEPVGRPESRGRCNRVP